MKLYIKNMVCNRCKMVVKSELVKFGLHPTAVELGEAEVSEELNGDKKKELDKILQAFGFELMDNKKSRIIEKIKTTIVELIYSEYQLRTNFSDHISKLLGHDYSYISNLFTEVEGISIEKYFIAQKIERVKELLVYDELSLSEIAVKLYYSDVSHLSKQFKKVTGLTPSHFKKLKDKKRRPIEEL
jgi:AraC-like DNA-binding protein